MIPLSLISLICEMGTSFLTCFIQSLSSGLFKQSPKGVSKMEKSRHVFFLYFVFPRQFPTSRDSSPPAGTHMGFTAFSVNPTAFTSTPLPAPPTKQMAF